MRSELPGISKVRLLRRAAGAVLLVAGMVWRAERELSWLQARGF
ncbi:hypothetical protein N018_04460 [Pseudomonas syringae CC1557]|uniref:Uncharacterized protein n=1 Tax=Pseudomonas syringae CC1557 TaxID=1357279 RepID=W0MQM5_PSESX|nr:hypothetical protein N018_04460 [Pseudomonas syringae CC1557]